MLCLKLSSVYFQYVNEQTTHVKIDTDSNPCRPGPFPVVGWFSTAWVL